MNEITVRINGKPRTLLSIGGCAAIIICICGLISCAWQNQDITAVILIVGIITFPAFFLIDNILFILKISTSTVFQKEKNVLTKFEETAGGLKRRLPHRVLGPGGKGLPKDINERRIKE